MEIPNAFIENQEQGIKFFKSLSSDFESIQSIAIQTIIADRNLSFIDKNEYIDKFKELIGDLLKDIDSRINNINNRVDGIDDKIDKIEDKIDVVLRDNW